MLILVVKFSGSSLPLFWPVVLSRASLTPISLHSSPRFLVPAVQRGSRLRALCSLVKTVCSADETSRAPPPPSQIRSLAGSVG